MSRPWTDRDWAAVESTIFQGVYRPSDGFAQIQQERVVPLSAKKPRRRPNQTSFQEKPAGRIAVMMALRYHFGIHCSEIARLMGLKPGKAGTKMASRLTLGGDDRPTLQWWERKHQQEAIQAAQEILDKRKAGA